MRARVVIVCDRSLDDRDARMGLSARLYAEVARLADVVAVTRVAADVTASTAELVPGLIEHRIPRSAAEAGWQEIARTRYGPDGGDDALWFERVTSLNPAFVETLRTALDSATCCICVRPYAYAPLRALTALPIVYDALQLEYPARALHADSLPNREMVLEEVARMETACVRGATAVITADTAAASLGSLMYDVEPTRFTIVRRLDLNVVPIIATAERRARREATNLAGRTLVLFAGENSPSDVRAALALSSICTQLPDWTFVAVGWVAQGFPRARRPANLQFTGPVDDATLALLLDICDFFIDAANDPQTEVAATTLFAAAHGAPLILTAEAAAEIFHDGVEADVVPIAGMTARIRALLGDCERRERQSRVAAETAKSRNEWSMVSAPVIDLLSRLTRREVPA
jgi:glycosyltransferase involved in cell wall biosynthesis